MAHVLITCRNASNDDNYTTHATIKNLLEALVKTFESHLKDSNPNAVIIGYTLEELFNFLDKIDYLACFVQISTTEYKLHEAEWIKGQLKIFLTSRILKENNKITFQCKTEVELLQEEENFQNSFKPGVEPLLVSQQLQDLGIPSNYLAVQAVAWQRCQLLICAEKTTLTYIRNIKSQIQEVYKQIEILNKASNDPQCLSLKEILMKNLHLLQAIPGVGNEIVRQELMQTKSLIFTCCYLLESKANK